MKSTLYANPKNSLEEVVTGNAHSYFLLSPTKSALVVVVNKTQNQRKNDTESELDCRGFHEERITNKRSSSVPKAFRASSRRLDVILSCFLM